MKKDMHKRLAILTATLFLVLVLAGSVSAVSDIGVEKTVDDETPNVGDSVIFNITATNYGPDEATQVVIQDYMSAESNGFEYVSHNATQGTYNSSNGLWIIDNFANGATATLNIQALVMGSGNLTNIATKVIPLSEPLGDDPYSGNDVDFVTLQVPPAADVGVEKWVDNDRPNIGDILRFYIEVFNYGPDNAANITVVDILPIDVGTNPGDNLYVYQDWIKLPDDFQSASLNFNDVTNTWTIFFGNINPGDYGLVYLDILLNNTADAGNTFTNTATKTASSPYDWNTTNDQSSADFYIPLADWTMTKTVDDVTPNVGDLITWVVTYTNTGPDDATGIIINDVIPAGLNVQNLILSTGTYDAMTGDWSIPFLASGANATLTVVTEVTSAIAGTVTTNVANKTAQNEYGEGPDFVAQAIYVPVADVAITKTVNDTTPNYWDSVIWTVTVTNNGPDTAEDVVVLDVLSSGLVILDAVVSQGILFGNTWFVGDMANAATATLNITTLVNATGVLNNTVYVGAETYDNDTTNNQGTASVYIPPTVDIEVNKTVDNPTPNYLDTVLWTVSVTNNGPDVANNVVIGDIPDLGLTISNLVVTKGLFDVNWSIDTLAAGETAYMYITTLITASNTTLNNTAYLISVDEYDRDDTNDESTASVDVAAAADLLVNKTTSTTTPFIGEIVQFVITTVNAGPDNATNVVVNDLLPAGLTFISASVSKGTYNEVDGIWTIGDLNVLESAQLIIFAEVEPPMGTNVTNTADISGDQYDPFPENNHSSVILQLPVSDLSVTKTADNTSVNVGDTVIWTVTLTNSGPVNATNIELTDVPPAGFAINSVTPSVGTFDGMTGVWSIPSLLVGQIATLVFDTTAQASAAGTYQTNTITVTALDQYDLNPASDSATVYVQAADVAVTKTVSNTTPNYMDYVNWTVTATNNGPDTATGVQITDIPPAGLNVLSVIPSQGTFDAMTGVWNVGTLFNGASATLSILTRVVASNTAITNIANLTAVDQYDWNDTNNSGNATISVPAAADLVITKTVNDSTPTIFDTIFFTYIVQNRGPDTAIDVRVIDVLPEGLQYVSSVANYGSYNPLTGIWTIGNLPNGAIAELIITSIVERTGSITNIAKVESLTYDPILDDNTASVTVDVQAVPEPPGPPGPGPGPVIVHGEVPMQATGTPLVPLLIGLLAILTGLVVRKK